MAKQIVTEAVIERQIKRAIIESRRSAQRSVKALAKMRQLLVLAETFEAANRNKPTWQQTRFPGWQLLKNPPVMTLPTLAARVAQ